MANQWDEATIIKLIDLWKQGGTSRQISETLGKGFTRNAVIGKIHRLRLAHQLPEQERKQNKEHIEQEASVIQAQYNVIRMLLIKFRQDKKHIQKKSQVLQTYQYLFSIKAQNSHCQWPIGTPGHHLFRFCPRVKKIGTQYCQKHLMIVYKKEGHYNSKVIRAIFNIKNTSPKPKLS